jgi:DNA polymerase-3 subunit delta
VGISKEYNVFELQDAFAKKDKRQGHPDHPVFRKQSQSRWPIQLILPSIYNFFSKAYMIFGQPARREGRGRCDRRESLFCKGLSRGGAQLWIRRDRRMAAAAASYNLKSIGIGSSGWKTLRC